MRIADHPWREEVRPRAYGRGFVIWLVSLAAVFAQPLYQLAIHAAHSSLHSHILLIPFVSAYLIYLQRKSLPTKYYSSPGLAVIPLVAGFAAAAAAWGLRSSAWPLSENDYLALMA